MEILNLLYNRVYTHQQVFSFENMLVTGITALISYCLFLFWVKKKALLNFQAWALSTGIINTILTIHYSPLNIFITHDLTSDLIRILMFLQFLTTVVTIFRLWQISEKYIPPTIVKKYNKPSNLVKKIFLVRSLAIWNTIKNGGNDNKNVKKLKKILKT